MNRKTEHAPGLTGATSGIERLRTLGPMAFLILMMVTVTALAPRFLSPENLLNVLRQAAPVAIVGVGMTFVIISGGIDLSVGSAMGLCAVVASSVLVGTGGNVLLGILASLATGLTVGFVNGIVISRGKIIPFIVTLAMMLILKGATFIAVSGRMLMINSDAFKFLGQGWIGPVPFPVVVVILMYAAGLVVLNRLRIGGYVYAIGGNEPAAVSSGISLVSTKLVTYCLTGVLVGVSAVISVARVGFAVPTIGQGVELQVITAVILGGTSLQGGKGSLIGTLVGAITMGVLSNGLILLRVSPFYQDVIRGMVFLLVVAADRLLYYRSSD